MTDFNQLWSSLLAQKKESVLDQSNQGWVLENSKIKRINSADDIDFNLHSALMFINSSLDYGLHQTNWQQHTIPFEDIQLWSPTSIDTLTLDFLKLYWPLAAINHIQKEKSFVLVHMAASLDGRIATKCGDSKWIGNDQNLKHAHRLRALVDGVMVGARTIEYDCPSLNVRHVEGENPVRLVLSNKLQNLKKLQPIPEVETLIVRDKEYQNKKIDSDNQDFLFFEGDNEKDKIENLFKKLFSRGIKSILIEGGAQTVSSMLRTEVVDVVQIHIAPILLGSGKHWACLPEIEAIAQSKKLKNTFWCKMGDTQMITGLL